VEGAAAQGRGRHSGRDRAAQDGRRGPQALDESDGSVDIELSDTRIRFATANVTLVSKLIDGTFPTMSG